MSQHPITDSSPFSLENIPFGVFSTKNDPMPRVGTRITDYVIDLSYLETIGTFADCSTLVRGTFSKSALNDFMECGRETWSQVRISIQKYFSSPREFCAPMAFGIQEVTMHIPCAIGNYTDFYASREHATNVGTMFRGKENALMPNWLHLPVGYHGRASSVIVSGTRIRRPCGQIKIGTNSPICGPTQKLDFELEAFIVGKGNELGTNIPIEKAEDHIFGIVLMNDWSARDIQSWEYVPLGPFLGKSFATTISPWVVTLDALQPFRVKGPEQTPTPLSYLDTKDNLCNFDVDLEVCIEPQDNVEQLKPICKTNLKCLYWSFAQMLAHHTINGCNMRSGDLCGSGTISGASPDSYGSLLELSWNGETKVAISQASHHTRSFLEDGDTVIMTGTAKKGNITLGFGECIGKVLSAQQS